MYLISRGSCIQSTAPANGTAVRDVEGTMGVLPDRPKKSLDSAMRQGQLPLSQDAVAYHELLGVAASLRV